MEIKNKIEWISSNIENHYEQNHLIDNVLMPSDEVKEVKKVVTKTKLKQSRLAYKKGETIQVIRLGNTSNDKIEQNKKRKIVQTYTFSRKQYELIQSGADKSMKIFFGIADANCLDCPYNSFGKCYTHKFNQYVGFISMLKSIAKEFGSFDNLPTYSGKIKADAIKMSQNTYVRFGTYGEPSLMPTSLITSMINVAESYTGYTHQWSKNNSLGKFFMASTHTKEEETKARLKGYRSFMAVDKAIEGTVNCPASKEGGYKSTCSKCSLCSGTDGTKVSKSIYILNH